MPALSHTSSSDDFSVLSGSGFDLLSRSSTTTGSDAVLVVGGDGMMSTSVSIASTSSFSDVGQDEISLVASPRTPSQWGSSLVLSNPPTTDGEGEDDDDDNPDEFILIPPSSALLRPMSTATFIGHPPTADNLSEDDEEEEERILVLRSPVLPSFNYPFSPMTLRATPTNTIMPMSPLIDEEAEEELARARQRALRDEEEEDGNEGDDDDSVEDDEEEEDIVLTGHMQQLSLSSSSSPPSRQVLSVPVTTRDTPTPTPTGLHIPRTAAQQTPTPSRSRSMAVPTPIPVPVPSISPGMTKAQLKASRKAQKKLRKKARKQLKKLQAAATAGGGSSDTSSTESSGPPTPVNSRSPGAGGDRFGVPAYADAIRYVSSCIQNPPGNPSQEDRLHFLQALIIELGLLNNNKKKKAEIELPTSCRAAKALLKSQVHINVGEYVRCRTELSAKVPTLLAPPPTNHTTTTAKKMKKNATGGGHPVMQREQAELNVWLSEVPKLMFPSKAALRRGLHSRVGHRDVGKVKRVTTKWIKKRGLDVFLVNY